MEILDHRYRARSSGPFIHFRNLTFFERPTKMEEKGKGFSLRQKKSSRRPPISAPKQISSQGAPAPRGNRANGTSEASASTDLERPKVGGNTSDLVKRRYSTRFTTLPDFSNADAPPMPALPGDPQSLQQRPQAAPTSSQKITVDLAALRVKGLQAEQCKALKSHLQCPFEVKQSFNYLVVCTLE